MAVMMGGRMAMKMTSARPGRMEVSREAKMGMV
jgi:hypothetical protein